MSKNKSSALDDMFKRLRELQAELEKEWDRLLLEKGKQFNYSLNRGKVVFERNIRRIQIKERISSLSYLMHAPFLYIISAPVIYIMIIPLSLLDLCITVYQQVCFRIYKIPLVQRKKYIIIDRHHLPYLNTIQKFNCIYCSYGNGVIAYSREIIARTEQYWCPIKHALRTKGAHSRVEKFMDYGDSKAWRERLIEIRQDWEDKDHPKN